MRNKGMQQTTKARLFAVVLLVICAFAGIANAQTFAVKFTLPFEVQWGRKVLPAGEYSINMDSSANVALIRSADGTTVGFTPIPIQNTSHTGNTALFIMVRGNERIVRSLNLPTRGVSLVYQPTTSAQREMLAHADKVKTVPVITAGK